MVVLNGEEHCIQGRINTEHRHLESISFHHLSLLFKVNKVELEFLWNIWLLLVTKFGHIKSFACYF